MFILLFLQFNFILYLEIVTQLHSRQTCWRRLSGQVLTFHFQQDQMNVGVVNFNFAMIKFES